MERKAIFGFIVEPIFRTCSGSRFEPGFRHHFEPNFGIHLGCHLGVNFGVNFGTNSGLVVY